MCFYSSYDAIWSINIMHGWNLNFHLYNNKTDTMWIQSGRKERENNEKGFCVNMNISNYWLHYLTNTSGKYLSSHGSSLAFVHCWSSYTSRLLLPSLCQNEDLDHVKRQKEKCPFCYLKKIRPLCSWVARYEENWLNFPSFWVNLT